MANIPATVDPDVNTDIKWALVTETDTALETFFHGGEATIEVTGTFDSATVQMQFGTVAGTLADIDTDEHPDGAKFTSAGVCNVNLARGYIKPSISGGGATQSLNITVRPLRKAP